MAIAAAIVSTVNDLFMNGPEIFTFSLKVVPSTVSRLLEKAKVTLDQIDLFIFHQANLFMLEHLRQMGVQRVPRAVGRE